MNTSERKVECEAHQQTSGLTGDQALVACLEVLGGTRCSDRAQVGRLHRKRSGEQGRGERETVIQRRRRCEVAESG